MQHSNCLTAAHTLPYKPLAVQWTTCLVSLLRFTLFTDCLAAVVTRLACCLTSCLPVLLGNAARAVCLLFLSNQRASARLGSARVTSAHFGSTRHGKEKHSGRGGVYPVMRRPRHNTYTNSLDLTVSTCSNSLKPAIIHQKHTVTLTHVR
jgi:hypothetical protein